jgi:hypothetical protein
MCLSWQRNHHVSESRTAKEESLMARVVLSVRVLNVGSIFIESRSVFKKYMAC